MGRIKKPYLMERNLSDARKILFSVTRLLDHNNIPYHLEGGTLLGIVRDKELLPWDHDVDISLPKEAASKLVKLRFQLILLGYKMSIRKSKVDAGPISKNSFSIFKIKPLIDYCIQWIMPKYESMVMDVFVKTKDQTHTYWQAKDKVMRVENKFYNSFETVEYTGRVLKVPNLYRDYLTQKYGDWSVPIKEWDCAENELAIYDGKASIKEKKF